MVYKRLQIVMAQVNLMVGDLDGNTHKIAQSIDAAKSEFGADLIVFPELSITSYPPEDLLHRNTFLQRVKKALKKICEKSTGIDVLLGYPEAGEDGLYNVASYIRDGHILATYRKHNLPNYSVFDEMRYFRPGSDPVVVDLKGVPIGITICEDVWFAEPIRKAVNKGAELILNLNASPFDLHKPHERSHALQKRVQEHHKPIVYVNLVGGQDELVFDGASFVMDANGSIVNRAPSFEEGLFLAAFEIQGKKLKPLVDTTHTQPNEIEAIYKALVVGVRDYVEKNRFPGVIMGLSGGIDSALTLAIAADAIGAERVEAVMLPSRYTSEQSLIDAREEARILAVEFHEFSIESMFEAGLQTLAEEFSGTQVGVTEENMQARCRGLLLMAISNKKNKMLLTTGNKSEMAVGYATLYGDMCGGFNALKDVPKTVVYKLAEYRNSISQVIPQSVLEKAPSAELAPDQKDSDSLPDYAELDAILELFIEQDKCCEEISQLGYDAGIVQRVIDMVNRNEYKRRQAAPGVRITRKAFGRDRRYPITSGYR